MEAKKFDLIVIGAGPGGTSAATTAAKAGQRVAIIEKDKLGGTCLNYGCDPTKTLLYTARLLHQARRAHFYGLEIPEANFDWQAILSRVEQVQNKMRGGTPEEAPRSLEKNGPEVIMGAAQFINPHQITVANETFEAEKFIIAAGNRPVVPPVEGLQEAGFITNIEAVQLPRLPRRLAIVGGGAIGIEFSQLFRRLGVEVTVLESSPVMLEPEDREVATKLLEILQKEGIRLQTGAKLEKVETGKEGKRLFVRHGKTPEDSQVEEMVVDEILLATGRQPNLEGLGLGKIGVKTGKQGIEVDVTLRTSLPHIWAVGDITGGYQFTHVAEAQGALAAKNAFTGKPEQFDDRAIAWVTFTDPELAHLGQTEEQLRDAKITYRVARQALEDNPRALTRGETSGLVKLLVDEKDMILGAHLLGVEAGEIVAPLVLVMQNKLPVSTLKDTILPYPTLAQSLAQAAEQL